MKNRLKLLQALLTTLVIFFITPWSVKAQDPKLPAVNLGLVNMQDGNPPGTGMVFQEVIQVYNSNKNFNGNGVLTSAEGFSTVLAVQQFIHITDLKFLGGNFGYTAIIPFVKIMSVSENGQNSVPVNPGSLGDITAGPMVQWFDKHLGSMKFSHRLELDASVPVGAYSSKYAINPSSHFYTFSLHHAFTIFPSEKFSISMRNHIHYNTKEMDSQAKAGMFYHNNYSFEYALSKSFRVEAAGYYLYQFQKDSYKGDYNYYQNTYGISDTRESVLAYGLGLGYLTPSGTFLELKGFKESEVKNRTGGIRASLLLNFKLN